MRGHFRSHDKDGDHTIQSAVVENPMLTRKPHGSVLQNLSYGHSKFYIAGIGIFNLFFCDLDFDRMTFILQIDPYFLEIYQM